MKTLVVFYSRTGVTAKVARALAERIGADLEELHDTKKRRGRIGFVSGVVDAVKHRLVPIEPPEHNPADYDLVVLASPVWANTMCSAMRSYLNNHAEEIETFAMFCTTHSSGIPEAQTDMQAMLKGTAVATAGFRQKHVKRDEHLAALNAFADKLKQVQSASTDSEAE